MKTNHYSTLGLEPGADPDEITAAYVALVSSTTNAAKLDEIERAYEALTGGAGADSWTAFDSEPRPVRSHSDRASRSEDEEAAEEDDWEDEVQSAAAEDESPVDAEASAEDYDYDEGEDEESAAEEDDWEDEDADVDKDDDWEDDETGDEEDEEAEEDDWEEAAPEPPARRGPSRGNRDRAVPIAPPPGVGILDPHRVLGLSPKASPQQIQASYDRLIGMTKRPKRRAEIERAYRMLSSGQAGFVSSSRGRGAAADSGWWEEERPTRERWRPVADEDDEDDYYVPTTRAKARRARKLEREEWRAERAALQDYDPYRQYLYIGFAALAVIVVAMMVFVGLNGGVSSGTADYNTLVQRGNAAYDNKKWADAEKWYGQALAVNGGDTNVRTDYGVSLYYQGKNDQAIAQYQAVLVVEPNKTQTLTNLGIALSSKTPPDIDGAVAAWQKVVDTATNPADVQKARDLITQNGR